MIMQYVGSILIFLLAGTITCFGLIGLFEFWRRTKK